MAYLDGKPKDPAREINIVSYNTFIEKQSALAKEHHNAPKYKANPV